MIAIRPLARPLTAQHASLENSTPHATPDEMKKFHARFRDRPFKLLGSHDDAEFMLVFNSRTQEVPLVVKKLTEPTLDKATADAAWTNVVGLCKNQLYPAGKLKWGFMAAKCAWQMLNGKSASADKTLNDSMKQVLHELVSLPGSHVDSTVVVAYLVDALEQQGVFPRGSLASYLVFGTRFVGTTLAQSQMVVDDDPFGQRLSSLGEQSAANSGDLALATAYYLLHCGPLVNPDARFSNFLSPMVSQLLLNLLLDNAPGILLNYDSTAIVELVLCLMGRHYDGSYMLGQFLPVISVTPYVAMAHRYETDNQLVNFLLASIALDIATIEPERPDLALLDWLDGIVNGRALTVPPMDVSDPELLVPQSILGQEAYSRGMVEHAVGAVFKDYAVPAMAMAGDQIRAAISVPQERLWKMLKLFSDGK